MKKDEKDLWFAQRGNQTRTSGKSVSATFMFSALDELATSSLTLGPIIIETDSEKVLTKAAEYAAQKGYDLVSPDPEQNLKIIAVRNDLAGEEIAEGSMGPSITKALQAAALPEVPVPGATLVPDKAETEKQSALAQLAKDQKALEDFHQAVPFSDDAGVRVREAEEYRKRKAELDEREKGFQEKGWLPGATPEQGATPAVEKEAAAKPRAFGQPAEKADDVAADIAKIAEQTAELPDPFKPRVPRPEQQEDSVQQQFPVKAPPDVLAHRYGFPTVRDHGNRLTVTQLGMLAVTPSQQREREAHLTLALLKARERFGDPVRITGNPAFEKTVIDLAIAQGIPLEMGTERGEKAYAKALEAAARTAPGIDAAVQFEPSRNRAVEKETPAPARGVGLGLAPGKGVAL